MLRKGDEMFQYDLARRLGYDKEARRDSSNVTVTVQQNP